MDEKDKYEQYDKVVNTIMMNILVERERCGMFLLYDFNPKDDADVLYYNVTTAAADLRKENIYLNMPLLDYIKFRKKRSKNRSNLRWFNPILNRKLDSEHKTSIYLIMEFIKEQLNIDYSLYKEINDEYYRWSLD